MSFEDVQIISNYSKVNTKFIRICLLYMHYTWPLHVTKVEQETKASKGRAYLTAHSQARLKNRMHWTSVSKET